MSKQIEAVYKALKDISKKRKKVFELLGTQERFGWEKWLQVELASSLNALGDPEFECVYKYDDRFKKSLSKASFEHAMIDLQFRAKNHLKDKITAIEIKVSETEKGLGPLLSDFRKIRAIGSSQWSFRSVIGILAHGKNDEKKATKFSHLAEEILDNGGKSLEIGNYQIIVFGWESEATENMSHESYKKWFRELEERFRAKGVHKKTALKRDANKKAK